MIYFKLFWSFFQIGLFSFGGGYAAMPLVQNQVADIHNWLSMSEFVDVVTISQMTPGPIGINSATFVGLQIGGFWGAVIATAGFVLPSCIIVLFLAHIYNRYRESAVVKGILNGLGPAVVAMISSAGLALIIMAFWNGKEITGNLKSIDYAAVAIFTAAFILLRKWKANPVHVMIGAGVVGFCIYSLI